MNYYRVTGKLPYTTYCPCEHCEGHTKDKQIDNLIDASSELAAMLIAVRGSDLEGVATVGGYDDEDDLAILAEALTVVEAPPALVMQALGIPTLFDMEAHNA